MPLLVGTYSVAARLGLAAGSLTPTQEAQVEAAIEDAQGKVAAYLNRSLVLRTETVKDLYPTLGYELTDYQCWADQVEHRFNDRYDVTVANPAASGEPSRYDVTFAVGLDVANDPDLEPIRRFLIVDAVAALRLDPAFTVVSRAVTSVSADGQSVSYEKAGAVEQAGAPMALTSLNRWRRRPAYARPSVPFTPWPYA